MSPAQEHLPMICWQLTSLGLGINRVCIGGDPIVGQLPML